MEHSVKQLASNRKFQERLTEEGGVVFYGQGEALNYILHYCGVDSVDDIREGTLAGERFNQLLKTIT